MPWYNPTRFTHMINTYGGVETAKHLVSSGNIQYGLQHIVKMGHYELSMEPIILETEFASLFTEEVLSAFELYNSTL